MTDTSSELDASTRHVAARTVEAGEAHAAIIERTYPTDLHDMWDACTNPERLPRWFLPVSGDLRPGGRFTSKAMPAAPSSAASRRTASAPPGRPAAQPAGSSCG